VPGHARDRGAEDEPLDLTDDLYHRIKAGLFQPTREPLVLRLTRAGEDGREVPARGEYAMFSRDEGSFGVRSDDHGAIVVHMDMEAALSHLSVNTPRDRGLVREFHEDPRHPIR